MASRSSSRQRRGPNLTVVAGAPKKPTCYKSSSTPFRCVMVVLLFGLPILLEQNGLNSQAQHVDCASRIYRALRVQWAIVVVLSVAIVVVLSRRLLNSPASISQLLALGCCIIAAERGADAFAYTQYTLSKDCGAYNQASTRAAVPVALYIWGLLFIMFPHAFNPF
ncbi:hypothetical protein BDV93DRAFT_551981 [Ceratobasidium sp. AG-I]|nr:hypothetical protein BDV93DRAFT_551981 [Ceratobasidium sp. AG-I]